MYTYHGYNGREYNSYQTIIYTDSLNIYTAYTDHGGFSVPTDGGAISYGIDGGIYELITISGNSIVSALTFYNGYAVQDDDMTHYSNFNHYPSKDKVIGDVTYYCFSDGDGDIYLTDISEGTKMRVYKKASSNMGPLSNYGMYFISGSTPIENVTENSGNTLTIHESNGLDTINVSLYNLEAYNKVIGGITFYAYIIHDAYKTAYRILSNQESGITDANDDRLLLAICNENKNTGTITEDSIMMLYLTDISQGPKTQYYLGQYTLAYSSPGSTDLDPIFDQLGKVDISESHSDFDIQITVSNNPNLDNDIAYEIEHMSSGNSSSDSGNGDEEGLLSNFITHKNWIVRGSSNGTSEYSVQRMILSGYNESVYDCVRFEPYDFERNGVHYYAFIDKTCYDAISGVVGNIVDVTESEFVRIMTGSIEMASADYDTLITAENSMDIIYLTSIGQSNSILSCYAYKMGISVEVDAETGDAYVIKGLLSEGTESTANMTTINYAFAIEMDSEEDL